MPDFSLARSGSECLPPLHTQLHGGDSNDGVVAVAVAVATLEPNKNWWWSRIHAVNAISKAFDSSLASPPKAKAPAPSRNHRNGRGTIDEQGSKGTPDR